MKAITPIFYCNSDGYSQIIASLTLDEEGITIKADNASFERNLLRDVPDSGVEEWMKNLPRRYNGIYLRASLEPLRPFDDKE